MWTFRSINSFLTCACYVFIEFQHSFQYIAALYDMVAHNKTSYQEKVLPPLARSSPKGAFERPAKSRLGAIANPRGDFAHPCIGLFE